MIWKHEETNGMHYTVGYSGRSVRPAVTFLRASETHAKATAALLNEVDLGDEVSQAYDRISHQQTTFVN